MSLFDGTTCVRPSATGFTVDVQSYEELPAVGAADVVSGSTVSASANAAAAPPILRAPARDTRQPS